MPDTRFGVLAAVVVLAALPAIADNEEEARVHFRVGAVKYTEGNVDAALAEFQLAYTLNPSYKILYNIGQCYMEQERFEKAYEAFSKYLSGGKDEVPADRKAEVEKTLQDIKTKLGGKVPKIAQKPAAPLPPPPAPAKAPPPPPAQAKPPRPSAEAYVPDPRAADQTLSARPADMSERDWYGVSAKDMRRFEAEAKGRPDLMLGQYLEERSRESWGLTLGEILTGAGAGAGVAVGLGGYLGGAKNVGNAGVAVVLGGVVALVTQLIIDAVDIGEPRLLYPKRLKAPAPDAGP
ncbi:MAG: tetratricopeptide repeat protein [Deltaproteobacteria bacterium]|nr:tetratricopeptide repeat protein [Deltaproteobacteria bacterium]